METGPKFSPEKNEPVEPEEDNKLENLEGKMEEVEENSEKLKVALEELDGYFFQDNQIPIEFREDIKGGAGASHYFEKDDSGNYTDHYYEVNESLDKKESNQNLLLGQAVHEVRHRLQHDKDIRLFNRENIDELQDKSQVLKTYREETGESVKEKIEELHEDEEKQLSPNDFDAVVVEDLTKGLLTRCENVSSSEIIKKLVGADAKEVVEKIDQIIKEDKERSEEK